MLVLGCGTSSLPLDLAADGFAVTATDIAPAAVERMRARATALVSPETACRPKVRVQTNIKRLGCDRYGLCQGSQMDGHFESAGLRPLL